MPAPIALTEAQASNLNNALSTHAATMDATNRRIDEVTELLNTVEQNLDNALANGGNVRARGAAGGAQNVVRQFTESEQFGAFVNGAPSTGRVAIASGIAGLRNATTLTSDGGGYGTSTAWSPRLGNLPQRRLQLLDVLPIIPVENAGAFQFNRVPAYVNAAAQQAKQGDAKAQADVAPVLITAPIVTVAHFMRASQQVIQDASALTTQLTSLLAFGVRQKLESMIVNSVGAPNVMDGILNQATAYASTPAFSALDKIGDSIAHLDSLGWSASVVALSPADWYAISSSKSAGSGEYLLGEPGAAVQPSVWGVPVSIVPSLPAGTALVLDASQVALLDRLQTAVLASREDGSNFTSNLVTLLAECRAGLAVFSPSAVLKVALAVV